MCLCHQYYYLLCPLNISSLQLGNRVVRILSYGVTVVVHGC